MNVMDKINFLGIGDIVTDAFITLKDATVNCDINREHCTLCVRFGDKIPYDRVDVISGVGNAPNATVAAYRLGIPSAIYTNLGDDNHGNEMIQALKQEGINTKYVKTHIGKESNYHYVLRYEAERTILVKHHEYEYTLPEFNSPPEWIYLSSLAENSLPFHNTIAEYVEKNPGTKLVFQPGTFQIKLGKEKLERIYETSELFFSNKEEAQKILSLPSADIKELLHTMRGIGPNIVVITDGPEGAYAFDGNEMWWHPMYPDPKPPVDRTGAGDSFASTFTIALALGKTIPEALSWAPINSMSVVQYIGAQKGLVTREQLDKYLAEAPPNYKPKKI
jgi:ribokinase